MNEILGNAALWPAEQLANSLIASDAHIQKQLAPFVGKALQLNIALPPLSIRLVFDEKSIHLSAIDSRNPELPVDAVISGSAKALIQLLVADSSNQSPVTQDIEIEGDALLVQDLFTRLNRLDLQWQDYLSVLVGDVGTQHISQAFESSANWAKDSRERVHASMDDYLKEEARLFPHAMDIMNFQEQLDRLRLRVDRVQARAERLKTQMDVLAARSGSSFHSA